MIRAIKNIIAVYSKDKVLMRLVTFFMGIRLELIAGLYLTSIFVGGENLRRCTFNFSNSKCNTESPEGRGRPIFLPRPQRRVSRRVAERVEPRNPFGSFSCHFVLFVAINSEALALRPLRHRGENE